MSENTETTQKEYELSFLTREESGQEAALNWIRRLEGEVTMEGPTESITLSYPIEKQSSAYFGFVHFKMAPTELAALNHELQVAPEIIRFLIITPPFVKSRNRISGGIRPDGSAPAPAPTERKPAGNEPISNEALEKKIEEILQQQ